MFKVMERWETHNYSNFNDAYKAYKESPSFNIIFYKDEEKGEWIVLTPVALTKAQKQWMKGRELWD